MSLDLDNIELATTLVIFLCDVAVLWVLFRIFGAVVSLSTIVLIAITLLALTLLEFGFFAYILGFVTIYYLSEKYSTAEGSDVAIITVIGGMAHFGTVVFFDLLL